MSDNNIHRQLKRLYLSNFLGNISIAGAAWVLLLVLDGYSLVQVGLAETVFHAVSLMAEIPSGVFADVFGRKKSLVLGCVCGILSAVVRGFTTGFPLVLLSIAFSALSYNFASGSDSALAYDSLAEINKTDMYDIYISRQTVIYRISNGLATLCAGLAAIIGNRNAQILSVFTGVVNLVMLLGLKENKIIISAASISVTARIRETYKGSFNFLKGNRKVATLIFRNALVGAIDVLLLFFLQAKLPMTGIREWSLGPLLFVMSMGGTLGAYVARKAGKTNLRKLFRICFTLVLTGLLTEFTGIWYLMTVGGMMAAFADDMLQIRSDIALNEMIPASQRATLISVNSFCFSLLMIVMSPLAGWVFSL